MLPKLFLDFDYEQNSHLQGANFPKMHLGLFRSKVFQASFHKMEGPTELFSTSLALFWSQNLIRLASEIIGQLLLTEISLSGKVFTEPENLTIRIM